MRKFVAQLTGGEYINIPADGMKIEDTSLTVYRAEKLVAFLDTSCILTAILSDKPGAADGAEA